MQTIVRNSTTLANGRAEAITGQSNTVPARTQQLAQNAGYQTILTDSNISQYGSVSELNDASGSFFVLELVPGASDKTYVIGDPFDIVEFAAGVSWDEPTRSTTGAVAGIKNSFVNAQVIIGMNYQVTTAGQFGQPLRRVMGDNSGAFTSKPLNVQGAQRNTQYDDKLLTIKFPGGLRMDQYNAITIGVKAGETVTLTFFVGATSS